jgi:hypothetical protein
MQFKTQEKQFCILEYHSCVPQDKFLEYACIEWNEELEMKHST